MNEEAAKGLAEYRAKVERGEIEVVRLTPVQKLAKQPNSLRCAINAACYQCMGGESSWRQDVRDCTSPSCGLYNVRVGA